MVLTLSYVKLQEAFAVEQNKLGTWAEIGYKDPSGSSTGGSTSNFTYVAGTTAGTNDWGAYNIVGMNDCAIATAAVWKVQSTFTASTGNVVSTPSVTNANCKNLTPNFCAIGAGCSTTNSGSGTGNGGNG